MRAHPKPAGSSAACSRLSLSPALFCPLPSLSFCLPISFCVPCGRIAPTHLWPPCPCPVLPCEIGGASPQRSASRAGRSAATKVSRGGPAFGRMEACPCASPPPLPFLSRLPAHFTPAAHHPHTSPVHRWADFIRNAPLDKLDWGTTALANQTRQQFAQQGSAGGGAPTSTYRSGTAKALYYGGQQQQQQQDGQGPQQP